MRKVRTPPMKAQLIVNSQVRVIPSICCKVFIFYIFNIYFFLNTDNLAEEHVANIHQDDDGFESLNGNVSSDNDKVGGRIQVQRNRSRAGTTRQTKDRTSWSEDSTSQQISPPSKRSGLLYKYILV